jgi:hypothetical protein
MSVQCTRIDKGQANASQENEILLCLNPLFESFNKGDALILNWQYKYFFGTNLHLLLCHGSTALWT